METSLSVLSMWMTFWFSPKTQVFEICRKHGLTIGLPKCEFAVSEIKFLGFTLSLTKDTDVIKDYPFPPINLNDPRKDLWMIKDEIFYLGKKTTFNTFENAQRNSVL